MMQTVTATFENGVFKPAQPVALPEHTRVSITIELPDLAAPKEHGLAALERSLQLAKPQGRHLSRDQLHERR
jgi:predicted DNA-binding antitoxin AbrB/MazE fold protein